MDEQLIARACHDMARVTIGQAVLDVLEQGQTLALHTLRAHLQQLQDRAGPTQVSHYMHQAALQRLTAACANDLDKTG